jgi:hypothetical protein
LAGDAGHFKDPVIAQGIRDALRFGRTLGEYAAPVLDDPAALDAALEEWELDRDAQCLPHYQWANGLGRDDAVSPIEAVAYQWFHDRPGGVTELLDVFSRKRRPDKVFTPARFARWAAAAVRGDDPKLARATIKRDLARESARLKEAATFKRRRAASAAQGFTPNEPA